MGELLPLRGPRAGSDALSDEALVAACGVGDEVALGLLFDRHREIVRRFLARMIGGRPDVVEDLVQATFVEVWSSAARFRNRSKARTWLLGIAHNLARGHLRKETRRRMLAELITARPSSEPRTPEQNASVRQDAEAIARALAALSPKLRAAFVLAEIEGVAGAEAAAILGIRTNALWRRVYEARKRLRAALENG